MPKAKSPRKPASSRKSPSARPAAAGGRDPAVDRWFAASDHPLKPHRLRVRRVILASDKRVSESVKWSTALAGSPEGHPRLVRRQGELNSLSLVEPKPPVLD